MEILIVFITILAALLGIFAYWHKYVQEPTENKKYLLSIFESAKHRNKELLKELSEYAQNNNSLTEHYMQGFTFQESIEMLKKIEQEMFNDENLQIIKNSKGSGKNFDSLTSSVEQHTRYLIESQNWFRQFFK